MSCTTVFKEYKALLKDKYKLSEKECCDACDKCRDFYDEAFFEDDVSGDTFDDLNEALEKTGKENSIKMTEDFLTLVKKEHLK